MALGGGLDAYGPACPTSPCCGGRTEDMDPGQEGSLEHGRPTEGKEMNIYYDMDLVFENSRQQYWHLDFIRKESAYLCQDAWNSECPEA